MKGDCQGSSDDVTTVFYSLFLMFVVFIFIGFDNGGRWSLKIHTKSKNHCLTVTKNQSLVHMFSPGVC